MNELQVTVQQTPGIITWNFEELKTELATQMEQYKAIVYTDDNVADAKSDLAALRKLAKAVDSRRIEIKNKCLEPYTVIEGQANELKALINEPIALIDEKVKDYEARRKAAKKEKIMRFMADTFADLDPVIRKRLEFKTYDTRWENAGTADKVWKEAVQAALIETQDAIHLLADVDEDFKEQVMEVYKTDLNLTAAMVKANELQKQKDLLIERERQRREQERQQAEEAARREAEAQTAAQIALEPAKVETEEQKPMEAPAAATEAREQPKAEQSQTQEGQEKVYVCMVKLTGTAEQIQKTLNYIRFLGGSCEVQKNGNQTH